MSTSMTRSGFSLTLTSHVLRIVLEFRLLLLRLLHQLQPFLLDREGGNKVFERILPGEEFSQIWSLKRRLQFLAIRFVRVYLWNLTGWSSKSQAKLTNMKSVDRTPIQFKKRFSGLPGEDWISHIDMLEIHRANKHQWSARQFYYGLQHTLAGRAKKTIEALEEELECPTLYSIIPDWFETEMEELRAMIANKITYPQLEPRTKIAVVIAYFQEKFQEDTADSAWDDFRFAAQEAGESIEEWGTRIKRLRNKVQKYGIRITWQQYLRKWTIGTKAPYFTAQLREALCPADFRREPVVTDLISFESWYQRFLRRQRERSRDLAERARLVTLQRLRAKSRMTNDQEDTVSGPGGTPKGSEKGTGWDRYRQGPASRLPSNKHSCLFTPGPSKGSQGGCDEG